jgi:hypothetical protein
MSVDFAPFHCGQTYFILDINVTQVQWWKTRLTIQSLRVRIPPQAPGERKKTLLDLQSNSFKVYPQSINAEI